jgi:hypothetical protein
MTRRSIWSLLKQRLRTGERIEGKPINGVQGKREMEVFGATRQRFFQSEGPVTSDRVRFNNNAIQSVSNGYRSDDGIPPPDLEDMVIIRRQAKSPRHSNEKTRQPLGPAPNWDNKASSILRSGGDGKRRNKKELHVSFAPDVLTSSIGEKQDNQVDRRDGNLRSQNEVLMKDLSSSCSALTNLRKEMEMATAQIRRQDSEIMNLRKKLRRCELERDSALRLAQSRGFGREAIETILTDLRARKLDSQSDDLYLRDQKIAAQQAQIQRLEAELSGLREIVQKCRNPGFSRLVKGTDDPRRFPQARTETRFPGQRYTVPSDSEWG